MTANDFGFLFVFPLEWVFGMMSIPGYFFGVDWYFFGVNVLQVPIENVTIQEMGKNIDQTRNFTFEYKILLLILRRSCSFISNSSINFLFSAVK